jgi:hypothetical protein
LRGGGASGKVPLKLATTPAGAFDFSNANGIVAAAIASPQDPEVFFSRRRFIWNPGKAAFRAGAVDAAQWDDDNVGVLSAATGLGTRALGLLSFAVGNGADATEANSIAIGEAAAAFADDALAIGRHSSALGVRTTAFGVGALALGSGSFVVGPSLAVEVNAVAFGVGSIAAGEGSIAMGNGSRTGDSAPASLALGRLTEANGQISIALGTRAKANGNGSFAFGDRSTDQSLAYVTSLQNQFTVRALGGTIFFTSPFLDAGVTLAPAGSAWLSVSDANLKEGFRDRSGDDVLAKLARIPIREWSYKSQDAAIRHVGPTAQDFHAAFGLGEDPLAISTIDADGVALRAVQALDARTRAEHERLAADGEQLARDTADLEASERALAERATAIARLKTELVALCRDLPAIGEVCR